MPLSRLENFLKNVQGNVLYVNPEELDATDDVSNRGNSRTRPFRTIQRALIESARFSYQPGQDNDRFDKTTIHVSTGVHFIDNRPGHRIDTSGNITDVNGTAQSITEFSIGTNFDIQDPSNVLHIFNSIEGGVILPRGTSIIGSDLRKTKIRPKYIPDPNNSNIPRTAIFRVTGGCFFFGFSLFDGDPADRVFRDFTLNTYNPNYSHHKLTCFEYADGVNLVGSSGNTDLDMYYAKLTRAYGTNSGRELPVYPANKDFQKIDKESKIVGPISQTGVIEISDIFSGATSVSTTATKVVTVITKENHNLTKGTAILVNDVNASGSNGDEYDGTHVVAQVLNDKSFTYQLSVVPATTALPNLTGINPTVIPETDTVSSASPYIFNCSLRSVFGMNGLHADGNKATGFKSMVAAQFTGIGLQKDDNAFVKYNTTSGVYEDQATLGSSTTLHVDSLARFKPDFENFHIKASNKSVLQLVSIFAIGYTKHFITESGGDFSLTNSNSNFGSLALVSQGFRDEAFIKDDRGFITSLVPPQKNLKKEKGFNWLSIATGLTTNTSGDTKLFISKFPSLGNPPTDKASGSFTVGNKIGDKLSVLINGVAETADILMPTPQIPDLGASGKKTVEVGSNSGINSITSGLFTLQTFHQLLPGESVRVISDNGSLPDGLENNRKYFAVTTGIGTHQLKLASSRNAAINGNAITGINNLGGKLNIISTVDDKKPGEEGHPIQYDSTAGGWYINVNSGSNLYSAISTNADALGEETPIAQVQRQSDNRKDLEKLYRFRYSIPEGSTLASEPTNGFVIQDSGSLIDDAKFQDNDASLTTDTDLRTNNNIITASWSSNVGIITTKHPHNLLVGQPVQIKRIKSANNTLGDDNLGFNRTFIVGAVEGAKTFKVGLNTDPGLITKISSIPYTQVDRTVVGSGRTFSPFFVRKDFGPKYQIFANEEVLRFQKLAQDGVYDLTILGYLKSPNVSPFQDDSIKHPQDVNDLKPTVSPDNPDNDPDAAVSFALRDKIGQVKTNDKSKSITKESVFSFIEKTGIGIGVTATVVSGSGSTKDLSIDLVTGHNFNGVESLTNITGGSNYGTGSGSNEFYYSISLTGGSGKDATADVTVSAAGQITAVEIVDAGSGYAVNDVLTVKGVPFTATGTDCQVTVQNIDNKIGDAIQTVGIGSDAYNGLNRITLVPDEQRFTFSGQALSNFSTPGGFAYHVGVSTAVNNIVHDTVSGIATVTLFSDIGLRRGDMIVINGANTEYNGTHVVENRIGYGSSLTVNIGASSSPTFIAGGAFAHDAGISMRAFNQNVPLYGGQTTVIDSAMSSTSSTISLQKKAMFRRGDYIMINEEILRIANKNCTQVIRGLFGTVATSHLRYNAARKIRVVPVENRRNSIIRASGHTFEYLGFGPGNYSTSLPQTQDRVLSDDDQLAAQSANINGGSVVYTGLNDKGEFFIGRKKIDAVTGEEKSTILQIDQTKVSGGTQTITNFAQLTADDLIVDNSLISNGDTDVIDLRLRGNRAGDIGQSVYLGISQNTPTSSLDNVILATTYDKGGYVGWVRTSGSNPWQRFGPISRESNIEHYSFDKLAINQASAPSGKVVGVNGDVIINGNIESTSATTNSLVAATAKVTDLTNGRVVIVGSGGELSDSSSLTLTGATLNVNSLNVSNTFSVNNITASGNVTASGTVSAEQLTSTDDASVADDLTVGGDLTVSGNIIGDVTGNVTGNVSGTVTGDVSGTLTGPGSIPVGGIIMWQGSTPPANYYLCNGSNGTPDLRGRFILGRGGGYVPDSPPTGGNKDAIAVEHSHSLDNHAHSVNLTTGGDTHSHSWTYTSPEDWDVSGPGINSTDEGMDIYTVNTTSDTHSHSVSGNTGNASGGTTASGSSGTNANLPPYFILAYIMRYQ